MQLPLGRGWQRRKLALLEVLQDGRYKSPYISVTTLIFAPLLYLPVHAHISCPQIVLAPSFLKARSTLFEFDF